MKDDFSGNLRELIKCGGNIDVGKRFMLCGLPELSRRVDKVKWKYWYGEKVDIMWVLCDDCQFPQYLLRVYKKWGKCCCGDKVGIGLEK